uniref:Putative WRKY transcription factor 2 n=1 Tax=Lilium longiflorum TaxID=4690 RepID=A0A6G8D8Y1_LILLO|nr:putative WRKY transcription factor 2 [Lilium longiflorum]
MDPQQPNSVMPNRMVPAIPEDGYEWRKYGQKYSRRISMNRSYFKCRNNDCSVKRKVEWDPSDPSNLRIVYDGTHNHPSPSSLKEDESSTSTANQYDLANQVLRPC